MARGWEKQNVEDYERRQNRAGTELPDTKPECHQAPTLGSAVPGKTESFPRTRIRFVGYRCRPLDPDNFAGGTKDLLDGLRHANLIEGDESWRIILETEQIKVSNKSDQKTVIILEQI